LGKVDGLASGLVHGVSVAGATPLTGVQAWSKRAKIRSLVARD
jgi:hypothetical protein